MRRACLLSCVVAIALAAPGRRATAGPSRSSILGGSPTSVGQYPTVVAIRYDLGGGQFALCSGTLIAPDWVLTAAHCVKPSELGVSTQQQVTDIATVIFDTVDLFASGGFGIRAADTIPHPQFTTGQLNRDVGLIRLASPVTDRAPLPLNRAFADAPVGISVTQVGYGIFTVGTQDLGVEHYVTDMLSIPCTPFGRADGALLCYSQQAGTGSCNGDSGGPGFAMIHGVVTEVGITSFGDQGCRSFGAETRVDSVYDWVADQLGGGFRCASDGQCDRKCGGFGNPLDADCPTCTTDGECGADRVCQDNRACGPAPLTTGGLGSTCTTGASCASTSCLTRAMDSLCSEACTPGGTDCPDGFDCLAESGGVCWPTPPESGGCNTGGASSAGGAALALGALLALRPRRQRPRA